MHTINIPESVRDDLMEAYVFLNEIAALPHSEKERMNANQAAALGMIAVSKCIRGENPRPRDAQIKVTLGEPSVKNALDYHDIVRGKHVDFFNEDRAVSRAAMIAFDILR